ncbi:MAG: hypothetical protein ACI3ZN_06075 [Candidatus Cryptobacteroides sp.]
MRRSLHISFHIIALCLCWTISSCSRKPEDKDQHQKYIFAIVPDYGPGDNGYYDMVIEGLSIFSVETSDVFHFLLCESLDKAEIWYRGISDALRTSQDDKALIVLASDEYAHLVKDNPLPPENCDILLFESSDLDMAPNIHTLELRRYGICYLAGAMVSEHEAWIIAAKSNDMATQEAIKGFADGYMEYSDNPLSTIYLTPDERGFCNLSDARREADAIVAETNGSDENEYCTILPLSGTANLGIYNSVNLTVSRTQVIGMDKDCSDQNDYIPFSIVIDIGLALYDILSAWSQGEQLPEHISEGLDSEYVYMAFSKWWDPKGAFMYWDGTDTTGEFWQEKMKRYERKACMKEENYEAL